MLLWADHTGVVCGGAAHVERVVAGVRGTEVGEDNPLLLVQELPLVGLIEWPVLILVLGADPGVGRTLLV